MQGYDRQEILISRERHPVHQVQSLKLERGVRSGKKPPEKGEAVPEIGQRMPGNGAKPAPRSARPASAGGMGLDASNIHANLFTTVAAARYFCRS